MAINLSDLPDVSFVDKDIDEILNDMISGYEKAYFDSTGERKKLYPGDPIRIFLYSKALRELHLRVLVDNAAKQNLLKYSRGDYLENLGAFTRTDRLQDDYSKVRVKIILSEVRNKDEIIPKGTRFSPDDEVYFAVNERTIVPAGTSSVVAETTCTVKGTIGNGFLPGQINILVDPLPWVDSAENIEVSQGGADIEDDDNYRERIHLAPEGFSVAGPDGAYEFFAKEYSALIHDIKINSPTPGVVGVRVLLNDGEIPTSSFLKGLEDHLSDKNKRPLTDKVEVSAPEKVNYDIDLTYYISSSDMTREELIKERVISSIKEYIEWQSSKIGRDVNPSELIMRIRAAGAKRVELISPTFNIVGDINIASLNLKKIEYGGLEDA